MTMSTASISRPLPRPLHLVLNSTNTSGLPTPLSASAHPLSAPLSLNMKGVNDTDTVKSKLNPRRQSSISYNTGSSKVQRSPGPGLGRSNSLGSMVVLDGEGTHGDENSTPKISPLPGVREIEPVTLAEKHADLLRFIAQKESKCLELRTQLAQHEADLLLLKRKWERIVSKGLPSSARSEIPTTVGSDMLDGIREGVQSGLGRVFGVLDSSPAGPSSISQPPPSTPSKALRHSRPILRDASTSSGKRASISTVSSESTRDRSSLSGSRSSASSLFDELPSPNTQSLASSTEIRNTSCPTLDTEDTSAVAQSFYIAKRNPSSTVQSLVDKDAETSNLEDDLFSKTRRQRPTSIHSHFPFSAASVASEGLTPLSKQMANWVPPGLNKKWEELKGNETLSKQSKRASILLNDVLAALAPPVPSSPNTPSSTVHRRHGQQLQPPSHHTLDSTFFDPTNSDAGLVRMSPSPSLLDEEEECKLGEVLQPQVKVPSVPKEVNQNKDREDKEEEEWNW